MTGPDKPKPKSSLPSDPANAARSAAVVPLRRFPEAQPPALNQADALKVIRAIASDTDNIVVIPYGQRKARKRHITRRQIELCVQKGMIDEGPFLNSHGHWQVNLYRHAAGEEITCVVAIEWATKVLVINAF